MRHRPDRPAVNAVVWRVFRSTRRRPRIRALSVTAAWPEKGTVVVTPVGDVDLATAPQLGSGLADQFESGPRQLVLDLGCVGFLGCAGLTILMAASDRARHDHVRLALVVNTHPVRRALHVTGLAGNFDCYTERRQAVAA